jgi:hypothetical protein
MMGSINVSDGEEGMLVREDLAVGVVDVFVVADGGNIMLCLAQRRDEGRGSLLMGGFCDSEQKCG